MHLKYINIFFFYRDPKKPANSFQTVGKSCVYLVEQGHNKRYVESSFCSLTMSGLNTMNLSNCFLTSFNFVVNFFSINPDFSILFIYFYGHVIDVIINSVQFTLSNLNIISFRSVEYLIRPNNYCIQMLL